MPPALLAQVDAIPGLPPGSFPTQAFLSSVRTKHRLLALRLREHGSFATLARRTGRTLYPPRKPRGYWDDIEALRREVEQFVHDNRDMLPHIPQHTMPQA